VHTPDDALCDDDNPCTNDWCVESDGCKHGNTEDGTPCPGGVLYACVGGMCVCVPNCAGKVCGDDGCAGVCGTCGDGEACIGGKCEAQEEYTCVDMMACGMACGFSANCVMGCYGQGDADSKALFEAYAMCLMTVCGFNMDAPCILAATAGECAAQYTACAAD